MERIFEDYYVQDYHTIPTLYLPPNNVAWVYGDARLIRGYFTLFRTEEILAASALNIGTSGRFTCKISDDINELTKLRRDRDDVFFGIQGDATVMPSFSTMHYKVWNARVEERPPARTNVTDVDMMTVEQVEANNRQYASDFGYVYDDVKGVVIDE